MIANEIVMVK